MLIAELGALETAPDEVKCKAGSLDPAAIQQSFSISVQ
jgi:hypothetical protein